MQECKRLIFKYLNIIEPNYYQIESYINVIAEQLILFTNSILFKCYNLNEIKKYIFLIDISFNIH